VRSEGVDEFIKFSYLIDNENRDVSACVVVPQLSTLPPASNGIPIYIHAHVYLFIANYLLAIRNSDIKHALAMLGPP
jgi:hypothetical protein